MHENNKHNNKYKRLLRGWVSKWSVRRRGSRDL